MSGTQPENDGIIPQKSLTVWDGMGKTRNVQKRESVDNKRSGNMEERRESYNNNFKSCFPHHGALEKSRALFLRTTILPLFYHYAFWRLLMKTCILSELAFFIVSVTCP